MKIRKLKPADINECVKMATESFGLEDYSKKEFASMRREFELSFQKGDWEIPKYFVAIGDDKKIIGMAGYVQSWADWESFEFFWLCVRKGYEGQGIATALVKHREEEVTKKAGFKSDVTIVFSCTNRLIKFHKKNGYKVILKKAAGTEVLMGKTFLKNQTTKNTIKKEQYVGIVPKDSTHKNSKIYNDLKNIPGTTIDMVKGIIFLDGNRKKIQQYLDKNRNLFEYTK